MKVAKGHQSICTLTIFGYCEQTSIMSDLPSHTGLLKCNCFSVCSLAQGQNNATTYRMYEHTQFHSGIDTQTQTNCAVIFFL